MQVISILLSYRLEHVVRILTILSHLLLHLLSLFIQSRKLMLEVIEQLLHLPS